MEQRAKEANITPNDAFNEGIYIGKTVGRLAPFLIANPYKNPELSKEWTRGVKSSIKIAVQIAKRDYKNKSSK